MDELDRLYGLLDEAHARAESGDQEAAKHAKEIYGMIEQAKQTKLRATETPPIIGGIAGAYLGAPVTTGYGAYKAYKGLQNAGVTEAVKQYLASKAANASQVAPSGIRTPNANVNWTEAMTGIAPPGSQMNKQSMDVANRMVQTIGPGGELAGGQVHGGAILTGPDRKAQVAENLAARAQALKDSSFLGNISKSANKALDFAGNVYKPLAKFAGPVLGGFQAASEGIDAINRFNRGDPIGGAISTVGGLSGLASMYPPAAPVAIPLSLTASGLNWLREKDPKAFDRYMQEMATSGAQ
jgi:hypothetical protein